MKQLAITCSLLFLSLLAFSQERQIKGQVTDDAGAPIIGASVQVQGDKKGTVTDKNGDFTLSVTGTGNVTLIITATNHKTFTISTDGSAPVLAKLEKDVVVLEDVVVTGYQTIKRKDLTASVSSIGAKDLKDNTFTSAAQALNGRLAGVTATTSEGSPDAAIQVRVRGGISITQNNDPLYVVDGVQVENALNVIAPGDIQSIDVLKDAAATAIYGARGANGVFVITTKTGKPGRTIVTYDGFVGVRELAN
ncbi:MAG: TonB-dependent receptor, partial [Bacteroidetes bacterium]